MSGTADRQRVRRSARQVGLWTGGLSALILAVGVGIVTFVIVSTSRVDHDHDGDGRVRLDHLIVDVDRVLPWVLLLGAVGVVLLGLVAWLTARRATRPLADALRAQRNFVADASHELRTPLTALSTRVQVLQRRHGRGEPIDDLLRGLRRDTRLMQDIVTELLRSAEAEAGTDAAAADVDGRDAAAVDEALHTVAETLRPVADAAAVELAVSCPPGLAVRMPRVALLRACLALVDNAVGHAPAGSSITLDASAEGRTVAIRVADRGDGIPADDLPRIFDRFARGAGGRARRPGFGLGLALVAESATRHGGTVAVERTSPLGTVFLLRLPAPPAPPALPTAPAPPIPRENI